MLKEICNSMLRILHEVIIFEMIIVLVSFSLEAGKQYSKVVLVNKFHYDTIK